MLYYGTYYGAIGLAVARLVVINKKIINNKGFVGSMSLVTKDVPENTTVVGIPAKKWSHES